MLVVTCGFSVVGCWLLAVVVNGMLLDVCRCLLLLLVAVVAAAVVGVVAVVG